MLHPREISLREIQGVQNLERKHKNVSRKALNTFPGVRIFKVIKKISHMEIQGSGAVQAEMYMLHHKSLPTNDRREISAKEK